MKKEEIKNAVIDALKKEKARSAWKAGVILYAFDILDNIEDGEVTEENLLNGAENWKEYSYGGCALIYDKDICHRLCTPSEIKRKRMGDLPPNNHENWLDTQARALYQAVRLIIKIKRGIERSNYLN